MRLSLAIALAALANASVQAQEQSQDHDDHQHHEHVTEERVAEDAPIKITINPEVRVSVSRGGDLPPRGACGRPIELPVQIFNHGFLTASLEARLVDSIPEDVSIFFDPEPLKGIPKERRALRIMLKAPGLVDITVAFKAKGDVSDLGGRDRVHLLVECQ
jgi:hypothetical protein